MKTSTATAILGLLALVLVAGWWVFAATTPAPGAEEQPSANTPITTAAFVCAEGKAVGAVFYPGTVTLTLSDGRTKTLPQATSGSGTRYAEANNTFVFWGKGNTAFVTEGTSETQTYTGCIAVAPDTTKTLTQIYATTSALGFTFRFPQNYIVDQNYKYQGLSTNKTIVGVKFTVPTPATLGTNLSKDTYISVEVEPKATTCGADLFLDTKGVSTFADNGINYSVATTSGAAAGNRYDEAVFAIPGSSPCTAVRYFIRSTNIGNYDPGTVREFDRVGLITEFDNIRRSLVLGR